MKIVIKVSGKMTKRANFLPIAEEIAELVHYGHQVIVVHGGGNEITQMLDKLGVETKFVNGLRVTTEEVLKVVEMVLCGTVNKRLVASLEGAGVSAIGISGKDGNFIEADILNPELGFVGKIRRLNTAILENILKAGYVPVIAPVGTDPFGNSLNINADTVASHIAGTVNADHLFLITDVPGIIDDKGKVIDTITLHEIDKIAKSDFITGGMIPKLEAARTSLLLGTEFVHIINWTGAGSIKNQIIHMEKGTTIRRSYTWVM